MCLPCSYTVPIMILIVYVSTTVFITQGNYIGYMFRLLNRHLQDYSLQINHKILCTHWDPSVFTSVKYLSQIMIWLKSQDSVHTLGSQCVYISEILKPDHDLA